jgi:hypothetical protein
MSADDPWELGTELAEVASLDLRELRQRYLLLRGHDLPKHMRRPLMQLAVAHAIRESSGDRLDRPDQRHLDQLVAQVVPNGMRPPPKPNRKIKSGTRLLREWQGRVHEVTVTASSFSWQENTYSSLSQIAKEITGTQWNGWVFFGLKRKPVKKDGTAPIIRKAASRRRWPATSAAEVVRA